MKEGENIKDLLNAMLKAYGLEEQLDERDVVGKWEELMGKAIAKRTEKIYLNKGILYIRLNSSVLRQELSYAHKELAERLNRELGKRVVKEIRFI